ncbi:transporter substrate-binding domain-containing protein [Sutcliffiella halmapala]|uniref:transporter substrate-binding domain-containing protein n=1 Tax=Sutcliffiella halmapala TaxID=79882 RepID=UPI000994A461|nr:transporter substrate-binding domain-containing protein [Sutcliffiella halmapala]
MKKFKLFAILSILTLLIAACGTDKDDTANESGSEGKVYRVGIDTTYPPFEFEKDGEYTGIDIDIINAIAEDQGFEIELKPMDFGGIIPSLQAGQLEVAIAGMSITEDRKKVVDFSDPYFDAGLSLVVANDTDDIEKIEDLAGKRVAVKNGTTGATFAQEQEKEHGFDRLVQFNDSPAMFQEVSNGNAQALIEDYPVIAYAIAQNDLGLKVVGERLTGAQYGIAVLKGQNDELLEKINAGLANLRESGKYDEILNKYLAE